MGDGAKRSHWRHMASSMGAALCPRGRMSRASSPYGPSTTATRKPTFITSYDQQHRAAIHTMRAELWLVCVLSIGSPVELGARQVPQPLTIHLHERAQLGSVQAEGKATC